MNYWWVNHKQTFRQEFEGRYVWCPKRKRNGSLNHFYETMRVVRRGDLVLSYADAALQGFGIALTHCYSCPLPDEFGKVGEAWDRKGWRVDVDFQAFARPLKVAAIASEISALLPSKYSPVRANGMGNQGAYFSEVSETLTCNLLERAAPGVVSLLRGHLLEEDAQSGDVGLPVLSEWEDRQQKSLEFSDLTGTTRTALIQSRRGQGLFRKRVIGVERECRITRVSNPDHLVASHIKPWRESNNDERLCAGNGLLLTPSIDHLFDKGFISFDDSGELIVSPIAEVESLERMGVMARAPLACGRFNSDQKHFLEYHRAEILLKPRR